MCTVKIFISSTMDELSEERESLVNVINENKGWKAICAETFHASTDSSKEIILKKLEDSHIYLGIFKNEYGTIPEIENPRGRSVTGLEYEWAKKLKKKILIFVYDDENNREAKLKGFLNEIMDFNTGHSCKLFLDKETLCRLAIEEIEFTVRSGFIDNMEKEIKKHTDETFDIVQQIMQRIER